MKAKLKLTNHVTLPFTSRELCDLHLWSVDTIIPTNEARGADFNAVLPQRHSWCCTEVTKVVIGRMTKGRFMQDCPFYNISTIVQLSP